MKGTVKIEDLAGACAEEYRFAKEKGFEDVEIVIETDNETYKISEYNGGFITDMFACVFDEIEDAADELAGIIEGKVTDIRIE